MQAVTNFEATRAEIEYAISVFSMRLEGLKQEEIKSRQKWIEKKVAEDLFRRPEKYWTAYASGNLGDAFERYRMRYAFQPEGYEWYSAKLQMAEELLKKFNCATERLSATEVRLSDADLTLLSVSLQSAC